MHYRVVRTIAGIDVGEPVDGKPGERFGPAAIGDILPDDTKPEVVAFLVDRNLVVPVLGDAPASVKPGSGATVGPSATETVAKNRPA
jgi:hypothetical protein